MKQLINNHRNKMKYTNDKLAIELKLIEELTELKDELYIPTSSGNLKKEIADVLIMIYALCEQRGYNVEEVLEYGILINEQRMVK